MGLCLRECITEVQLASVKHFLREIQQNRKDVYRVMSSFMEKITAGAVLVALFPNNFGTGIVVFAGLIGMVMGYLTIFFLLKSKECQ